MKKKKNPKYERIIEAAISVIAQHGYHRAQVAKIAKEAGVADGTIYLYFKSKEELLLSLFAEKIDQLLLEIRHRLMKENDFQQKFLSFIAITFHYYEKQPSLAVVTQLELRQANRPLRKKLNAIIKSYFLLIDELIAEGKARGYFKETVDYRLARQMVFGTLDEVITNWVMNDFKFDLASLAPSVYEVIIGGLGTEAGKRGE